MIDLHFIGCYDEEPDTADKGSICLIGGCEMVYDGNVWMPLTSSVNDPSDEEYAPFHKCEFCGTEYRRKI